MLNPQERHEQAIAQIQIYQRLGWAGAVDYWNRRNDLAVAAYYKYKTVAELELAVKACWR